MADRVMLITASTVQRVLNDKEALAASPMLVQMREAALRATTEAKTSRRCSSCASRAISSSVTAAFIRWVMNASPAELEIAKKSAGADAFLVHMVDPRTGVRSVKRI